MGKFKAPFSSQRSQETSVKRNAVMPATTSTSRKLHESSPLHLGRMDVVTPETKNKIKQRFAAGLAQLQGNIRDTSPGVPVPFDLSQSQTVVSQLSGATLSESQETVTFEDERETVEDIEENVLLATGADNYQASDTTALPEEFCLLFEDEDEGNNTFDAEKTAIAEINEKHEAAEETPTASHDVAIKVIEIAGNDLVGSNDTSESINNRGLSNVIEIMHVEKGNIQTKTTRPIKPVMEVKAKKPTKKMHKRPNNKGGQRVDKDHTGSSEYDFDCGEQTSKLVVSLGFQAKKDKPGHGRALRRLSMKKAVLHTIDKMHREIEELQQRRKKLQSGNGTQRTHMWTNKVALRGTGLEE